MGQSGHNRTSLSFTPLDQVTRLRNDDHRSRLNVEENGRQFVRRQVVRRTKHRTVIKDVALFKVVAEPLRTAEQALEKALATTTLDDIARQIS